MGMISFRDLVAKHLASHYPPDEGWAIQRDLLLDCGLEVHFLLSRSQECLMAHCKAEMGSVLFDHVDYAAHLAAEAGARSAVLYVPIGSFTPPVILAYAGERRVRIEAV